MARFDVARRSLLIGVWCVVAPAYSVVSSSFASAEVIAYEGFDYEAERSLVGRNGGSGWDGAWYAPEGVKGIIVDGAGLTFPQLTVVGGKSVQDGRDTRVFRRLDTARSEVARFVEESADKSSAKTSFGKDGTTIWISFLIANKSFPQQAHGGMHLMDGVLLGPSYKQTQRIQLGRQNKGAHWKLIRTDQGGPAAGDWDGTIVSDRTVRLLVYRFDFQPGPEAAWMWVDPAPGREPNAQIADLHAPQVADFRFNAVNVGSGGGATFDFDELRIGTTFAAVAPSGAAER